MAGRVHRRLRPDALRAEDVVHMIRKILEDTKTQTRISIGFGAEIILLLAMVLVACGGILIGRNSFNSFHFVAEEGGYVSQIERDIAYLQRNVLLFIYANDITATAGVNQALDSLEENAGVLLRHTDDESKRSLINEIRIARSGLSKSVQTAIESWATAQKLFDEADEYGAQAHKYIQDIIASARIARDLETVSLCTDVFSLISDMRMSTLRFVTSSDTQSIDTAKRLSEKLAQEVELLKLQLQGEDNIERADNLILVSGEYAKKVNGAAQARLAMIASGRDEISRDTEKAEMAISRVRQIQEKAWLAETAAGNSSFDTTMALVGGISLLALTMGLVLAQLIGRSVARPIMRLTSVMTELANGDYEQVVEGVSRKDEIGEMAAAVEVFKKNGVESNNLRRQVEDDRAKNEAERQRQEALLDRAVGDVVAAALAGNLTMRIEVDHFPEGGVTRRLGDNINQLIKTIGGVIDELEMVLQGMAGGDFTRRIDGNFSGVFARIQSSANETSTQLQTIVGKLTKAVSVVSGISAEIAAGSQDLAQRTESQAASIEQTAASMHEITTTIRHTAGNAQQANSLAMMARDTADRGSQVVVEVVSAVSRIETSASRISEIVGLIDEIAFQTNLLALNASVEAARAGEAGKGFAVVAQEVRNLAQRSSSASHEIKALIAESSRNVKEGAQLVNQAGSALVDIVTGVKKVVDIVAEISAASQEQSVGLEQVNTAVGTMDEMTQRNAALVEQTSAAAQSLSGQALDLSEMVSFFQRTDVEGS